MLRLQVLMVGRPKVSLEFLLGLVLGVAPQGRAGEVQRARVSFQVVVEVGGGGEPHALAPAFFHVTRVEEPTPSSFRVFLLVHLRRQVPRELVGRDESLW